MKKDQAKKDQWSVLTISCITEFGERYSYYIIQSLLIFFLIEHFGISQSKSQILVGTVMSAFYISSLVGGYVSDKILTHYLAALLGAILMACGNLILAFTNTEAWLFMGLAVISLSTGLIKSNISSFIGSYYDRAKYSEAARDFGFSIFYIGINLGIFCAFFVATMLKDAYGFSAPFYSSIVVCFVMVINLLYGLIRLRQHMVVSGIITIPKIIKLCAIFSIYVVGVYVLLENSTIANMVVLASIALCLFILYKSARKKYWPNVIVALIFFSISIVYWSIYFQLYTSILLFINKGVDHNFLGFRLHTSQFLSILSLWLLIMGAVMGKIWMWFENKATSLHDIDKFILGLFFIAIAMLFFYTEICFTPLTELVPAYVIFILLFIVAISELSLSAIGLSMVTKVAPDGFMALYMGIWLVTLGIGGKISGELASRVNIADNIVLAKHNMAHGLVLFTLIPLITLLLVLGTRGFVKKTKLGLR